VELTVTDRIVLLNVLPQEANLTTIRIMRELRDELSFSEDEQAELEMREDDGRIFWNAETEHVKDVAIGTRARAAIITAFEELDRSGKFKDAMLDTYAKFEEAE